MTEAKRKALGIIALGIAIEVVGFGLNALLGAASPRLAQMFSLLITFGAAAFVWGCIVLARAKGHPWYVGLLGLLSCLGLAVLWFAVQDKPAGGS